MGCTCSASPKTTNPVDIALDQLIASETIVLFRSASTQVMDAGANKIGIRKETELCDQIENILKEKGVRYRSVELHNRADGDALLCALKNRLQDDDDVPFLFVDLLFVASKKQAPNMMKDIGSIAERIKVLHQRAAERNA